MQQFSVAVSFDFANKGTNTNWFVISLITRYTGVNSKGYSIVRNNLLHVAKVNVWDNACYNLKRWNGHDSWRELTFLVQMVNQRVFKYLHA